jgi:hypothetical protein
MNLNVLTPFPEWEDEKYDDDEGNEWKSILKNERARKLYNQWLQVYVLLESFCDSLRSVDNTRADIHSLPVTNDYLEHLKEIMMADATIIPAKISGAEAGDLYVLRMENAAIIRKAASDVYIQCSGFSTMRVAKNDETEAVRREIDIFRDYFREWVGSFERDEFEDEWGLF